MYTKLFVRCFDSGSSSQINHVTNVLTEVVLYWKSGHILVTFANIRLTF